MEVRTLAEVLDRPDDRRLVEKLRLMLHSENFEEQAWPVLRILRVLPVRELAGDVCNLLDRSASGIPLAYDALYALANPIMAADAVPILRESYGVGEVVRIVVAVARASDGGAIRNFARLLAAFDADPVEAELAAAGQRDPEAAMTVRSLARQVREFLRREGARERFIPGYASDTIDVTRDDLDIREDVQTLTAVMLAKEVVPPLAIGLFGDWGTGKSFFMQSMKILTEQISETARKTKNSKFCSDVVAIDFNAWHYADTNLWASLVTHILESLARSVSPDQTSEEQHARLVKELGSAKEIVSRIEHEISSTEAQIAHRQSELEALKIDRERKEIELQDLRLTDLQDLLSSDPGLKKDIKKAFEDMGVPVALSSMADLGQAVAEVNSLWGRVSALAVGLFKGQNAVLVILLLAAVIGLPFLGGWIYQQMENGFVVAGTVITEAAVFVAGTAAVLRKAAGYVRSHVEALETAKLRVDEALAKRRRTTGPREEELHKQIVALKAREEQVASRLRAATAKVVDLEQRIATLSESRSLAHFLAERTKSDDYRRHLGLISTIRRDFEALTRRLVDPVGAPGQRRVERIVLYIDDLDRCPADKVVDVLQAVHLLLAYPLFVVVVGVDPRWLSHSLSTTYDGAFAGAGSANGPDVRRTTPQNYLEKIFQIPVSLRPMTEAGYGRLVQRLFSATGRTGMEPPAGPVPEPAERTAPATAPGDERRFLEPAAAENPEPEAPSASDPSRGDEFIIHDDALVIRPVEANFAEKLYSLLPTPRATKRFTNIYRILKSPVPLEQLDSFEGTEHAPGMFQVPMLLLAVMIGMPSVAATLFPELHGRIAKGESPVEALTASGPSGVRSGVPAAQMEKVREIAADSTFPNSPEAFLYWLPRVSRFSFEIGWGVRPLAAVQAQA